LKVRKGKLVIFLLMVITTLGVAATTTGYIWKRITLGLDLRGGFEVLYQAVPAAGQKIDAAVMKDTAAALEKRINVLGVSEPEITVEGNDRIRVQLAGVKDKNKARDVLGKQAELTFRDPSGQEKWIKGQDLKEGSAKVDYGPMGEILVVLQMKEGKKALLEEVTRKYIGQPMPIYLDETRIDNPVIRNVIPNGIATISGQKTVEQAQELVNLLNAGAIPVKLAEKSSFAVDASLGAQSLQHSLIAGLYAIIAIFIFVIGYYRLPGFIAVITLIAYSYLVLLTFWLLHVTLTLPGIAAYILGIGIAVDANIIMSERIREELRLGKSIPVAVRAGGKRSFLTIFDAHVTTLIAGLVLFTYGTAAVKGFAVSLIVGILVSFLTAVAMSRVMMTLWIRSNFLRHLALFHVKEDEIRGL
jgi:preprotein translocase subunit SecD